MFIFVLLIVIGYVVNISNCQNQTLYQALKSLSNDTSALNFNISNSTGLGSNGSSVSDFYQLVESSPSIQTLLDSSNSSNLILFVPINYAFSKAGLLNITSNFTAPASSPNFTNSTSPANSTNPIILANSTFELNVTFGTNATESIFIQVLNLTQSHIFKETNETYPYNQSFSLNGTGLFLLENAILNNSGSYSVLNVSNSTAFLSYNGLSRPTKLLSNSSNSSMAYPYSINCSNGIMVFTKDILVPQLPLNSTTIDLVLKANYSSMSNNTQSNSSSSSGSNNQTIPRISQFLNALKNSSLLTLVSNSTNVIFGIADSANSTISYNDTILSNQIFKMSSNVTSSYPITSPLLFNIASNSSNISLVSIGGHPLNITMNNSMISPINGSMNNSTNSSMNSPMNNTVSAPMNNSMISTEFSELLLNQTVSIIYPDLLFLNSTIFIVDKPFTLQSSNSSTAGSIRPKLPLSMSA